MPDTPPSEASDAAGVVLPALVPAAAPVPLSRTPGWLPWLVLILGGTAAVGLGLAWNTQQRLKALEPELVKRQQASQEQVTEAKLLSRQAHDSAVETASKLSLLEARVAESALQRSQVEELISSLSRSRDESVVADVEAALRVAQQQAAITGSAEPLVAVLKQADERLARYNQPRLERVRRAVARDLDRVRAVALVDLPSLSIRLDEAVRLVDELPLLSTPERRSATHPVAPAAGGSAAAAGSAPGSASAAGFALPWGNAPWWQAWVRVGGDIWGEVRGLVRVTQIKQPEAMLIAPEQAFFLRENLKLRLLNARLALLSRQFDQAQTDLNQAQQSLDRYFDSSSRRVNSAQELVRQVASQSRQVVLPRPDDTLAALAAAAAGR
ncbi:MAG TPA: uroporphyrinogen-III C-methyltransferase [Ideonella sp.]|uniref:uroporphyrinogen-III C-methyltransferase n=1 Tax=Ideonella sp. TaxID=1929293 RepID=UPI002C28FE5C|nr:uroporphyrinogen-III C-methyltransferase [Ideonella sp.]HSI47278.1 uroporphyrinogen-III C-methyltransferase [Ideonella sp.]